MCIGIVVLGFLLLYIYDFNSVKVHCPLFQTFFFLGSGMIFLATIMLIIPELKMVTFSYIFVFYFILFITSAFLLGYTLFFALPFDDTYVGTTSDICDTGVYALCRHPGVLWFLLLYVSLYGMFTSQLVFYFSVVANLLNFIYIIIQDCIIFPQTFNGYRRYRTQTPFLVPNAKSIQRCFDTIRLRG